MRQIPYFMTLRSDGVVNCHEKVQMLGCQEKLLWNTVVPVLKTDTGGLA